jgi:hypothetical protein
MEGKLDLVTIHTVQGELSAQIIKSRLESEGIPAMLKFETYFNLLVGAFTPFCVVVPRKFAGDAKMVIENTECDLINTIPRKKLWLFVILMLIFRGIGGD